MPLTDLSDELILEIAKQISNGYGNCSLSSLVRCSRRMNQIASPILYRCFTQIRHYPHGLPNLLRLVVEKPHIGREIRMLNLIEMSDDRDNGSYQLDMAEFSEVDLERCRSFIDELEGVPIDKTGWMTALKSGTWEAIVALLFFFTPLLEGITIESAGHSQMNYFNQVIDYMATQHHIEDARYSLRHLTSYSTAYWDTEGGMNLYAILPACAMPSITTVCASSIEEEDEPPFSPQPANYQVQNLLFTNSAIGGVSMQNLLRCFTRLRKLSYEHAGAIVGSGEFLPHRIGAGLTHLHDSLEEIVLYGMDLNEEWGDEPAGPLGSLSAFKKLRYVRVEAPILLGSDDTLSKPELGDILPASLETLGISDCDYDIYDQLSRFVTNKQQRFPVLKKVVINIPKMQAGGFYDVGADGVHRSEALHRASLEYALSHPELPRMAEQIAMSRYWLARIEASRPSEEEWEEWRARRAMEKELVLDFARVGVELDFELGLQIY